MTDPAETVRAFHDVLGTQDWTGLRGLLTDDARWVLPGNNAVSGVATGADAVVDRARLFVGRGIHMTVRHVLVGAGDATLVQHNTAEGGDVPFDEYVATVCRLRDGRIREIETFVSDIAGFDRFFAVGR